MSVNLVNEWENAVTGETLHAVPDVRGLAAALPFANESFPAVTFARVPWDAITPSAIGEAHRVTAPGGLLRIETGINALTDEFANYPGRPAVYVMTEAATAAGWTNVAVDPTVGVGITARKP